MRKRNNRVGQGQKRGQEREGGGRGREESERNGKSLAECGHSRKLATEASVRDSGVRDGGESEEEPEPGGERGTGLHRGRKGPGVERPWSRGARRPSAPPAVPASPPEGAPRSRPARRAAPSARGPRRGRRGRAGRPAGRRARGTGPESEGGRRPGRGALRSSPAARSVPAGATSQSLLPVGARGWGGPGWVEGGAPARQLRPPSRPPQTFTKRRVRPHQSPLIIVGWAAGAGGGPGPAGRAAGNGLCGGSGSRARRLRAEGGSEA